MDLTPILERCRTGDPLAWEALVRRFQARILAVAYHYAGNAEDARDLAQDIFIRIYRKLDSCADGNMFLPWILRIARNASIDYLRRRKARANGREVPIEAVSTLPALQDTPEEQSISAARKRLLHRALEELTDLNREVIVLKEIQGLPLEDIAALLEVPLGTIKSRCNRARIELARKVMALGGQEDHGLHQF